MVRIIYNILTEKDVNFKEYGPEKVYSKVSNDKQIQNLTSKLESLGVKINYVKHSKILHHTH